MKRFVKRFLAGLLCVTLILGYCPEMNLAWAQSNTSAVVFGDGFKVEFCVESAWEGYCNINVTVTNTGDKILENWMLCFEQPGEITNIWNAQIVEHVEGKFLIKNAEWNQDIAVGGSINFGYTLQNENIVLPATISGGMNTVITSKDAYEVEFLVQSSWDTGMSAVIVLKNVGEESIEDWTLAFDFSGEITSLWNGEIVERTENRYSVKNPEYQQNLDTGEEIQIGFLANGQNAVADNFELTQMKDSDNNAEKDLDFDGIPDEYELKVLYPLLLFEGKGDTVEDVTDIAAEDDYDNDGLTNLEEYKLGTSSGTADTDGDALSDKEEIEVYKTDPANFDTDFDGMMDGTEIALGMDPLNRDTDSDGILDGKERTENQQLLSGAYTYLEEGGLRAIPDIYVTGSGDYTSQITVLVNPADKTYSSLAYLVSEVFEIRHEPDMYYEKAKISFELSDGILKNNNAEDLSIVRLDGAMVYPIKSEYDPDTKTISAEVNELCEYAVENRAKREADVEIESIDVVLEKGKADVVFVIDTTGSMSYGIANVQSNLADCAELLDEKDLDVRYGLVEYRDIYADGIGSTIIHGWYDEVEEFRNAINNLRVSGGGDWAESAVDALNKAMEMEFRPGYQKYFMLVTDAGYKDGIASDPEYGMDDAISYLKEGDFCVSVVADTWDRNEYYDLYNSTGGIFADIYSDFYENVTPLIDQMEGDVHDEEYEWVRLSDYTAAPVAKSSLTDSDGDGIPDQTELGYVLYTTYDEYGNEVEVYFYRSNPNKADSDGDGFSDLEDPEPMKFNTVITGCDEGIVNYNTGKAFVIRFSEDYTVDEFLDEYRTRIFSPISKKVLETIKTGLDWTKNYKLSQDELALMGYIDEGQMRYLMQDKSLKDKVDLIVSMTDAKYVSVENGSIDDFYYIEDEETGDINSFSVAHIKKYFKLSEKADAWNRYFAVALKQALLGNYSKNANTVGIAAEIGLAFTGLDVYMDIRDFSYDATHFDSNWEWLVSITIDIASLLPIVGVLAKSDRFTAFAKHTDELYEMRRVVRAGEKISELGTQLKKSWKQLERSAATAYNYIGDKIRYNSLMDVMDNLKQTTRPQLAVESYNNIFVEVFADSDSVMRQMADLPLSQKQKIFRETILESTDSAGNVTKESYEIATIAKEKTSVVREAIESGSNANSSNRLALGLSDYLDDFATNNNAHTWKDFPNPENWKDGVNDALFDPNVEILVNLDGVDNPMLAVQRAASNRGGATDWELLQIKLTPSAWDRITWFLNGEVVSNPFN